MEEKKGRLILHVIGLVSGQIRRVDNNVDNRGEEVSCQSQQGSQSKKCGKCWPCMEAARVGDTHCTECRTQGHRSCVHLRCLLAFPTLRSLRAAFCHSGDHECLCTLGCVLPPAARQENRCRTKLCQLASRTRCTEMEEAIQMRTKLLLEGNYPEFQASYYNV